MAVLEMLKRLAGKGPNDVEAAKSALREVEGALSEAKADFRDASDSFGADLVAAMATGKPEAVEARLDAKRRAVDRLARAVDAITARLEQAQKIVDAAELAERWDRAEQALQARRDAMVRFEQAARELGVLLADAEQSVRDAWAALPEKEGVPPFLSLDGYISPLMSLATDGKAGGFVGSVLWDLRKQPGLLARVDADAAMRLSRRPARSDADAPPKDAA